MTASSFAKPLASTLTCHAWSGDGTQIAVCPNNEEVHIYRACSSSPSGWERIHVLSQHEQLVAALDWAPRSGQLLSCSHDRNAFVWTLQQGPQPGGERWAPEMVIVKHNRAALAARWSPCERKFAIGSGAKSVCVCHYDENLKWWGSSVVRRKHASSVVSVAWHPSSALLATASTDFKARVFNACVPGIDQPAGKVAPEGGEFGDLLYEVDCSGCWAQGVAWSPDGSVLAIPTHGSSVAVAEGFSAALAATDGATRAAAAVSSSSVSLRSLPLKSALFLTDSLLVGAGFDGQLVLIGRAAVGPPEGPSSAWSVIKTLPSGDAGANRPGQQPTPPGGGGAPASFSDRLRMFQSKEQQAPAAPAEPASSSSAAPQGAAIHTDAIVELRRIPGSPAASGARVSSCSLDGAVGVWDLAALAAT